ncbi:MAG: carboxypeptidase-like regulatory domain-containing protein [Acidobacteriia bacterium]|nr:carboxypeptidase-like regulatory domain-containing protein [Terriglobia bacterium]
MKKGSLTVVLGFLLLATSALGEEALLKFVVLRDYNGKPVRNAGVVMHPVRKDGKQSRGGLELKTDAEGKASFDGVPYGKLRVQVLAPGFQTFGQDYDINQPEMEITVKLKRPQQQYSIYEDHPGDKKDDKSEQKPPEKQPEQKPQ